MPLATTVPRATARRRPRASRAQKALKRYDEMSTFGGRGVASLASVHSVKNGAMLVRSRLIPRPSRRLLPSQRHQPSHKTQRFTSPSGVAAQDRVPAVLYASREGGTPGWQMLRMSCGAELDVNRHSRSGRIGAMDGLLAGRYRLGPVLGRGGMGTVCRAHDGLLDRDVAVKLLEVDHAPQTAVQRFRREAQFLAGLAHPNVVTVFDFGADDAQAWLVMELLAGPTLQNLVDQRGPLPIDDVRSYARQCAAALAAAHAAGITHRDVKPANLMLAADGTCKLLDL